VSAFHSDGVADNGYFDSHGLFQVLHIGKNGLPKRVLNDLKKLFMDIGQLHIHVGSTALAQKALHNVLRHLMKTSTQLHSFTFSEDSSVTATTAAAIDKVLNRQVSLKTACIPEYDGQLDKKQPGSGFTSATPRHSLTNTPTS
jgi:hypothetical protein